MSNIRCSIKTISGNKFMNYEELGFLAINKGDYLEAINIFKRGLEKKKDVRLFLGLGIANYKLEDYKTARWALYKALELEPKNKEALKLLSDIESQKKQTCIVHKKSIFRVNNNYLEILDREWKKIFFKGINIGLGLPGYFPGEYPIKRGTYLKWFKQICDLGANSIRIYTIHPPSFYEALYQFNNESEKKLYLFQGIWVELPQGNDFYNAQYIADIKESIKNAVEVVFGNANLPERPGYPEGKYEFDVSLYTVAFIFGREWEPCTVKVFNETLGRKLRDYMGNFLSIKAATPFEIWITEMCDFLQGYEYEKYGVSHPVSVTNWPTLDPLIHPSESNHEDELLLQGIEIRKDICNENEDMESLDLKRIESHKGNGFFITYHVYPYYPDFMNNDYLDTQNPYLAYLKTLKDHYGNMPVLIGEFGVPSSREVAHWHRDGWHHGGHNETRQGEINGLLMKAIYESGMAGGILFSWFDEWYKRNWLFLPYEIPAERNCLWFNIQDAEQNYGLLATYPNYPKRKVNLAGSKEDWNEAHTLYESKGPLLFRFSDGFDEARMLTRLLVQHDEGFIYLLIETKGKIDFTQANYIVGLDTYSSESGEFLFPLKTNLLSPIGLKFIIHLAGKEKSRILICHSYDRYLNMESGKIKPEISDQGAWIMMQNKTNMRRISKNGKRFYPSHVFSMSNLKFGTLHRNSPFYNSLADFFYKDNIIELRIPWSLINFTDPSSKMVLWMDQNTKTKKTEGIKIIVISFKPEKGHLFAKDTGAKDNITHSLPEPLTAENVKTYSWEDWDTPIYHTYLKESYHKFKEYLSRIPEVL